jgi:hypothetical protein
VILPPANARIRSTLARLAFEGADETEKWGQVIRAANIKPE